jgi:hypothetical protein
MISQDAQLETSSQEPNGLRIHQRTMSVTMPLSTIHIMIPLRRPAVAWTDLLLHGAGMAADGDRNAEL